MPKAPAPDPLREFWGFVANVAVGVAIGAVSAGTAGIAQTGDKWHSIKGQESLNGLNNWLRRNSEAPHHDRLVAQSLADELSEALGGVG